MIDKWSSGYEWRRLHSCGTPVAVFFRLVEIGPTGEHAHMTHGRVGTLMIDKNWREIHSSLNTKRDEIPHMW